MHSPFIPFDAHSLPVPENFRQGPQAAPIPLMGVPTAVATHRRHLPPLLLSSPSSAGRHDAPPLRSSGRGRISSYAHERVSTKLVGDALPDAVALDKVARLDVIPQNDDLIPHRTARLLDFGHSPYTVPFARPEREPRSVRTIEEVSVFDPDRDLDLLPSPPTPGFRHANLLAVNQDKPSRRSSFPRSNPTTTSPSMTVTGVAR